MQLNKVEISISLENEEMKLRKKQTESVSRSARGDKQRLELWNTFLPEIRKALKEVINGGEQKNKQQGRHALYMVLYFASIENLYLSLL